MASSSVRPRPTPGADQHNRDPGWRQRRIRRLERDVAVLERTSSWINIAVWGIAFGVMLYGAVNVTPLLIEHGVLKWTAPALPLMVDLAMCIGLWGDRIMHQYGRTAGWVTALRWITAAMTLALNIAGPVLGLDWVGLGIHACGPLLILVVAEAAGSFQRLFAEIAVELHTEIDQQHTAHTADAADDTTAETAGPGQPAPAVRPETDRDRPVPGARDEERETTATVTARLDQYRTQDRTYDRDPSSVTHLEDDQDARRDETPHNGRNSQLSAVGRMDESTEAVPRNETTTASRTLASTRSQLPRPRTKRDRRGDPESDPTGSGRDRDAIESRRTARRASTSHPEAPAGHERRPDAAEPSVTGSLKPEGDSQRAMWAHFQQCRITGVPVTGADLDREAGTNNYGRRVLREWVETGRITEQDLAHARTGRSAVAADDGSVAADDVAGQAQTFESPLLMSVASSAVVGGAG